MCQVCQCGGLATICVSRLNLGAYPRFRGGAVTPPPGPAGNRHCALLIGRRLYYFAGYFLFIYNAVVGAFSVLKRVLLSLVIGTLIIARMDYVVLMRGFEFLDSGNSFIAYYRGGSVAVWLACWTQAQKAWVQIAVATLWCLRSRRCLRQTVHTHRASLHQAEKLIAVLLRVAGVTAVLAWRLPSVGFRS